MQLFKGIFKYVWPQMRKFKFALFSVFFLFAIRTLLEHIIRPVFFKKIVDILSLGLDQVKSPNEILRLVAIIISLSLLTTIVARGCKFIFFRFEINVIRELRNFCFQKIQGHSQTFFANTFSGSLVTKSRRFVGSFESMFDIVLFNFWSTLIILTGVFVVLGKQAMIIPISFAVWIVFYFAIIFYFINRKVKYDIIEAAQDSRLSGRLADVFGNILAVKIFSAQKDEVKSFKKMTDDAAEKSHKAWFLGGKIEVIQAVLGFLVQSTLLYSMVQLWLKGEITTGTVVLVQTYIVIVFDKLWDFGNALTKFMKAGADMKEMADII
jgi:ATP-binding cassette subfamily B protein